MDAGRTTFVVSRVLKGRDWTARQAEAAADLAEELAEEVRRRGLVVEDVAEAVVEVGAEGDWARLSRTATAHRA